MLLTFLDEVADFRRPQGRRYELRYIILFSILAILSNSKSYRDIARFIEVHLDVLKQHFNVERKRCPGYTTVRNIIGGVETQELEAAFRAYTQSLKQSVPEGTTGEGLHGVAIDGKVLRGSFDRFNDQQAIQKLSFFDSQSHLILAHQAISEKTNEIPAVQQLLSQLELTGHIFTLDALHTQKQTFKVAKKTNKPLVTQLKDNQKNLRKNADDIYRLCTPDDQHEQPATKHRNRIEQRTTSLFTQFDKALIEDDEWRSYIKSFILVTRNTDTFDTKTKQYTRSKEIAYYICNIVLTAIQAARLIRNHWGIENVNHYVRDVTLAEDKSRIRVKPMNFAILRSFALNAMRANNVDNINEQLYRNSLKFTDLYSYQHLI